MDSDKQASLTYMNYQCVHRQLLAQYWMTEAIIAAISPNKNEDVVRTLGIAKHHISLVEEIGKANYELLKENS